MDPAQRMTSLFAVNFLISPLMSHLTPVAVLPSNKTLVTKACFTTVLFISLSFAYGSIFNALRTLE